MRTIPVINRKRIISDMVAFAILTIIMMLPLEIISVRDKSIECILSFLVNGIFFVVGMFSARKKSPISLRIVYWIFMFFFMYFAPMIQYLKSTYPWRGSLSDNDILSTNFVILLFNIFFVIGGFLAKRVRVKGFTNLNVSDFLCSNFVLGRKSKIFMTTIACALTAYSFSRTGILGIMVSRVQASHVFYSGNNSAIAMVVESVIPAFMAYTVAEAAQNMIAKKEGIGRFLLLFLCMLICFFPTSLPRYKTITIYGTIFLVLFPKLRRGSNFFWIFVMALFFVFPLMNSFRHLLSMENLQSVFEDGFLSVYTEADYDAYRMLNSAVQYTRNYGVQWGYQLLGALLFFVPRTFWAGKPGGSGAMLIRAEFGKDTVSNVSCPYIAEGYLNFGIIGVILFAFFLSVFVYKLDKYYWSHSKEKKYVVFSPYLFMVFMMFFVLRGDLLSGFAYVCGFALTGYVLRTIARHI